MPGPFQVSTAIHPLTDQGGPQGPYAHSGTLYCFAFSDATTLEAYKSADGGETWTATGSTRTIGSASEVVATCRSISGDYVHVLYVVPDGIDTALEVSRFNLSTGVFDDTSAAGPTLTDGAGAAPLLWIEESGDGGFGVMTKTFSSGNAHAALCTLSADLGTWSSLSEPSGQSDSDLLHNPVGIARGTDGRIHGFVRRATISTDEHSLLHVLVIGGGGGVGSAFDEIAAEIDDQDFAVSAAALSDGTIGVVYNAPDVGVGTNWKLVSAIAASADTPSWTYEDIDDSTAADAGVAGVGLIGGTAFRVVWYADGDVFASEYSSGWGAADTLLTSVAGSISGREISGGYGFFYSDFSDDPAPSFYFAVTSGDAQNITGVEPIATKEQFYNTSGVTGGGLETCGTPVPVQVDNTCNPVDPDTAIDAPATCVPQGYSF